MKNLLFKGNVDELGRLLLPADVRKALSIEAGDDVSLFLSDEDDAIVLRKGVPFRLCSRSPGRVKYGEGGLFS